MSGWPAGRRYNRSGNAAMPSMSNTHLHSAVVGAEGHLIDSNILNAIFDKVIERGGAFEIRLRPGTIGFDLMLGDGIVRARFRDSLAEETLMEPGTVYPMTIKLYPTSNVFKKGHRIRVDISSSNFPRFDLNPNTGEPEGRSQRWRRATQTVHCSADCPSRLILPIVPRRD
jgi:hypothetical protein